MAKRNSRVPRQETIELEDLLYGTPEWNQVVKFFKEGEFCGEENLVAAIEKYLQTEEQRKAIFDNKISIEKMLNGRTMGDVEDLIQSIYDAWNAKLGYKCFGSS